MGIKVRRQEVRLSGKELYVYYNREFDLHDKRYSCGGCTNKRVLSRKTGIGYDLLVKVFTRHGEVYYDNGVIVILKLYTDYIEKGGQSFNRRGRGGMEAFMGKYIRKRGGYEE
jgi:hypothetical protein